jgi:serine/threonine protein kinase
VGEAGEKGGEMKSEEPSVYMISESYNLSLFDLYCTSQAEKTNFQEDFLVEISFQVLKAIEYINRNNRVCTDSVSKPAKGPARRSKGLEYGFQGMLRMQNILFDENGQIKLQDMSHVHFDEYEISHSDLIYLPPEVLKGGGLSLYGHQHQGVRRQPFGKAQMIGSQMFQLNSSMDVWTLGMILLHCICIEYRKAEDDQDTFEEILGIYQKIQTRSLINFEEKIDLEKIEREAAA